MGELLRSRHGSVPTDYRAGTADNMIRYPTSLEKQCQTVIARLAVQSTNDDESLFGVWLSRSVHIAIAFAQGI